MSLRAVCCNLAQDGVCVRPRTVLNWVEGFVALAGAVPTVLVSDMAANVHAAWKETYRARNFMQPPTFHVRHIHAGRADRNNNQTERFNRELRALERATRGVKTMRTSLFRGMWMHHNFVRPHMGRGSSGDGHDRMTQARAAKIIVKERNVWIALVKNGRLHQLRCAAEAAAAAATAAT